MRRDFARPRPQGRFEVPHILVALLSELVWAETVVVLRGILPWGRGSSGRNFCIVLEPALGMLQLTLFKLGLLGP